MRKFEGDEGEEVTERWGRGGGEVNFFEVKKRCAICSKTGEEGMMIKSFHQAHETI
jgi:hypothetical protein